MTKTTTVWVVRFLDEHGDDIRQEFTRERSFMAARQLHGLLRLRTDLTDLEIFREKNGVRHG